MRFPALFRHTVAAGALMTAATASGTANASPGINGYSGKPNQFGVADTCDRCHGPNSPAPTLDVTIPTSVAAGSTHEVTVVVRGTRERTAINAAFSDGVRAVKGQNTTIPFPNDDPEEVAVVTPVPAGATGTYKFSFVAPSTSGTIKLWIAALSTNGRGTGGDGFVKATRDVTVTGGVTPPPDAGTSPGDAGSSDSGTGPGTGTSDAGTSGDGGGSGSSGGTTPGDDRDDPRGRLDQDGDESGCATTPARAGGSGSGAPWAAFGLAAAALVVARRARRVRR